MRDLELVLGVVLGILVGLPALYVGFKLYKGLWSEIIKDFRSK